MMASAAAGTSKAECTDAVVTLKMQTDLAHRRESMYGYKAAAHPVCQNTRDAFIYMHMIAKGQLKCARGTHPSGADQFYDLAT